MALSYPYEANAKEANVIFWFIGQSVSGRDEGVHHQFARYRGDHVQNAACYSGVRKSCRQDFGVKKG